MIRVKKLGKAWQSVQGLNTGGIRHFPDGVKLVTTDDGFLESVPFQRSIEGQPPYISMPTGGLEISYVEEA